MITSSMVVAASVFVVECCTGLLSLSFHLCAWRLQVMGAASG
jgi:hypothetical protein